MQKLSPNHLEPLKLLLLTKASLKVDLMVSLGSWLAQAAFLNARVENHLL